MCYGMKCGHENHMGECMWSGGTPYPCQTQYDELPKESTEEDEPSPDGYDDPMTWEQHGV